MINYILLRIAIIGGLIISPFAFIYTILKYFLKNQRDKINNYYYKIAFSLDQSMNVIFQEPLNTFMIKKEFRDIAWKFGCQDETMSFCIGKNKVYLSKFGNFWDRILNKAEKNHTTKAANTNQNNTQ